MLEVALFLPELAAPPAFLAVEFTADTGAEQTVINAERLVTLPGYDSVSLPAALQKLPQAQLQGIGGMIRYAMARAVLVFMH